MRTRWIASIVVIGSTLVFGLITLFALEGREVVVLRTGGLQGEPHQTRVWIADHEGAAIIEAANPERPFFVDLQQNPVAELDRNGRTQRVHAVILRQPLGHLLIRKLLRARYGWADWWIGLIADTSQSLAIRLEPEQSAL